MPIRYEEGRGKNITMAEIGKFNNLRIVKLLDFGAYLDGGEHGEILLPKRYAPPQGRIGDRLEVFLYLDSDDRLIATTETPLAKVGDFAFLKVVSVNAVGAFLDWGLSKDLLVPFREQKTPMEEGRSYFVYVYLDKASRRIVASAKLNKFLDKTPVDFQAGRAVDLLIWTRTKLGYSAIIDNARLGVLYENEVFQDLQPGQRVKGFIKKVRDDQKIDLSLQQPGYQGIPDVSDTILAALRKNGGFLAVSDASMPETIQSLFGISKKTFKKAVGALYKRRLITLEDGGLRLSETKKTPNR